MAAVAGVKAASATLAADTADTVTMSAQGKRAEVINHGTGTLWVRTDGTAAVALADENEPVLENERVSVPLGSSKQLSIIGGSGETPTYSVVITG